MNAAGSQAPAPLTSATALKIVASVVAVLGAVGALFYFSAVPGMEYYKYVDEVMTSPATLHGKRLKVHGYVVEGSILKKRDALDYKFKLQTRPPRKDAIIEVEYRGLVPDNFKPGAEVVAKGTLTSDNRLMVVKDGIDAKCPSKYEPGPAKLDPKWIQRRALSPPPRWARPRSASLTLLVLALASASASAQEVSPRARRLHSSAVVVDTHIDTPQRILIEKVDIGQRLPDGHVDIPRMRQGGLDALFFSVWIDSPFAGPSAVKRTLQLIDVVDRTVAAHSKDLALATSATELQRAVRAGKIAALMGIEGGHAIADDLAMLRLYRKLGVSYMTLTWANPTSWADSSGKENRDKVKAPDGLSDFGREVVREMNRIGMIVDISHVSDKTFYDVMAVTTRPAIASHSSCRALTDTPRNMTDDMLRALAKNGGVVGINYGSSFLDNDFRKRSEANRKGAPPPSAPPGDPETQAAWRYTNLFQSPEKTEPPALGRLIDHIDHAVKVAGVDHVGLGSDFDGVPSLPRGMEDVAQLPRITEVLLARGYSDKDIKKILGGNFLRVLRAVVGH